MTKRSQKATVILTDGTEFTDAIAAEAPTDSQNNGSRYDSNATPLTFRVDASQAYAYNFSTVAHVVAAIKEDIGIDEDGNPVDEEAAERLEEKYGTKSPSAKLLLVHYSGQVKLTFMEHTVETIVWQ